jgi:hypothetical protein
VRAEFPHHIDVDGEEPLCGLRFVPVRSKALDKSCLLRDTLMRQFEMLARLPEFFGTRGHGTPPVAGYASDSFAPNITLRKADSVDERKVNKVLDSRQGAWLLPSMNQRADESPADQTSRPMSTS